MNAHAEPRRTAPRVPGTLSAPAPSGSPARITAALGLALGLAALPPAPAQNAPTAPRVTVEGGFRVPIYEGNRTAALVSGRESRPALTAGQLIVTDFRLETFTDTPEPRPDLIISSPSATFDTRGTARSEGAIRLVSADERIDVSGTGWSWEQSGGLLVISNDVLTRIRRPGADDSEKEPPVEISAERLEYNLESGETRFLGTCVATQSGRARIRAGELASRVGTRDETPQAITATGGVVIEMLRPGREGQAGGETATYSSGPDGDRIEISGKPAWSFGSGSGSADQLILFPDREAYTARGSARMELATSPRGGGAALKASDPLVITSDVIEAREGEVVFSGPVVARQTGGLELEAKRVVARLAGGSSLSREALHEITATGGTVARLPAGGVPVELRGERMVYSVGEHERIEVTGDPSWSTRGSIGRARRFLIHPEVPVLEALDGVRVDWHPAGAPEEARSGAIQLVGQRMVVEEARATFFGDVDIHGEAWRLRSPEVQLHLATNGALREFTAHRDVRFEYRVPSSRPADAATDAASAEEPGGPAFDDGAAINPRHVRAFLRHAAEAARVWEIDAEFLRATLAADGGDIEAIEASGGVTIDHEGLDATGGALTYHRGEGLLRLIDSPTLQTADGLHITGLPSTALLYDPATGRFGVKGRVQRMTLSAQTLEGLPPARMDPGR